MALASNYRWYQQVAISACSAAPLFIVSELCKNSLFLVIASVNLNNNEKQPGAVIHPVAIY
jgi:hypothetical protein